MANHNFNPGGSGASGGFSSGPNNPGGPGGPQGTPGSTGAGGGISMFPPNIPEQDDATSILIDYNEKFKDSEPTLHRDTIIQQTLSCLIGKFKPNALLIGAAGFGKTKIVEDIARRIANNDPSIPDQLKEYTIYELPLGSIVSGSRYVGDLEEKITKILDFATDPEEKVILFIDEIHMLIGKDHSYEKIAQIMKPALSRNDLRVIGATTLQENQDLMNDPAFSRRFTRCIVDELSQEQTVDILQSMKTMMFTHYGQKIAITDKVIQEVVTTADEYKTMASHRPDNAITLLDRAMADAYVRRQMLENQALTDPALQAALQATPIVNLSKTDMKRTAMRIMTGNNEKADPNIQHLAEQLRAVKGQDDILDNIVDIIRRDSLNIYPRLKPLTLLFTGNSGVGKTEVAKIIANELTNTKPIILNMTEYHSAASINRIIGSPAGYVGSDSKQELPFDILESNPYQIILLDEFEKSDPAVQRLFMSAFEEGNIKTSRGKIVDFTKSIIIATTNAGHTNKSNPIGFTTDDVTDNTSIEDLADSFDVELLNRFTKVMNFHPITKSLFTEILCARYESDVKRIKANHSSMSFIPDTLDQNTIDQLVKDNYVEKFGARPVNKTVQKYIENLIIDKQNAKAANAATTTVQSNDD